MVETYKGRRVLAAVTPCQPTKQAVAERRSFTDISFREQCGIAAQAKRDDRVNDAALVAAYLAKNKTIAHVKAKEPKGQFLGMFGKKRVYSPVIPGSIYEKKARAITSQQFSRG